MYTFYIDFKKFYIFSDSDKTEFGLWVIRYACTIGVFIIGLKAPGLPRSIHQLLVNDEDEVCLDICSLSFILQKKMKSKKNTTSSVCAKNH